MRCSTLLALVSLFLVPQFVTAQSLPDSCVEANGLTWCYNPEACGQACNDVCAAVGGTPVADNGIWFEAQNTAQECENISQAFGLGTNVSMATYTYACSEDQGGTHDAPGGLKDGLLCSTHVNCPQNHRTNMDQLGVACGTGSRRSVCPCEGELSNPQTPLPTEPVPVMSGRAVIFFVLVLVAFGFITLRRRAA